MEEDAGPGRRPSRRLAFPKLRLAIRRPRRLSGNARVDGRLATAIGAFIDWLIRRRGYRSYCLDCRKMVWILRGKAYSREKLGRHTSMLEWCGTWPKKHRPPEDAAEQWRLGIK
jgi:hypothetical protein